MDFSAICGTEEREGKEKENAEGTHRRKARGRKAHTGAKKAERSDHRRRGKEPPSYAWKWPTRAAMRPGWERGWG